MKKNLSFIALGLVVGAILFLGGRQVGKTYSEKYFNEKYKQLDNELKAEKVARQLESDLRKKSDERIELINDSLKDVRIEKIAIRKKLNSLDKKYQKLLNTATDEELTAKLDSAFSQ